MRLCGVTFAEAQDAFVVRRVGGVEIPFANRVNSQELLIKRFDILEDLQSVVDSVSSDGHD